jgi:hypothetical protein
VFKGIIRGKNLLLFVSSKGSQARFEFKESALNDYA